MKKNVLKDIAKIRKERTISKTVEENILNKSIINGGIGVIILLFILIFYEVAIYLPKGVATSIYNLFASIMLIGTLVIIEFAYKKDSGLLALTAVEMIVVSIYFLFAPAVFIQTSNTYIHIFSVLVATYYSAKIIKIFFSERQKYWKETSDIDEIIKKESKDERAIKEKEKQQEEIKKILEQQENEKKSPVKSKTKKKTTQKKSTKKTEEKAKKETKQKNEVKKKTESIAKSKKTNKPKKETITKTPSTQKKEKTVQPNKKSKEKEKNIDTKQSKTTVEKNQSENKESK